jgi:hypothetical protein
MSPPMQLLEFRKDLLAGFFLRSLFLSWRFFHDFLRSFFLGGFLFNGHPKSPLSIRSGGFGDCVCCNSQLSSYDSPAKPSTVFLTKEKTFTRANVKKTSAVAARETEAPQSLSCEARFHQPSRRCLRPATNVRPLRNHRRGDLRRVRKKLRRVRARCPHCASWRDATTSFRSSPAR